MITRFERPKRFYMLSSYTAGQDQNLEPNKLYSLGEFVWWRLLEKV